MSLSITLDDLICMARTVYGEARGESFAGQVAVAHVILNRARRGGWFGKTVTGVCMKRWQFSCWNVEDPNRTKLLGLTLPNKAFSAALEACLAAIDGAPDETAGATHYYAKHIAPPKWAAGLTPALVEGGHLFFNNVS